MLTLNETNIEKTILRYENGIASLHAAFSDLTKEEFDSTPIPNTWTPRFLLAHLVDFEAIITSRLKLIIATKNPLILGCDESNFAERLNYANRSIQLGLDLYKLIRIEMLTVMKPLVESDWNRNCVHNEIGRMNLWEYFLVACAHSEHHLHYMDSKRKAWGKIELGIQLPQEYPPT